jgi:repressor LexA
MKLAVKERWFEAVDVAVGKTSTVPLLGTVAAGLPFHAFPVEGLIDVPAGTWNGRRVFALRVRGASMIEEGIHDGDYLIVEPRETAEPGQTVVADVDGGVTVKRLYRERDGRIRLQPANAELLPLVVDAARVRVIGAVVGVLRRPAPPPRARPRPRPGDGRTLDLTLRVIEQSVAHAETLAAARGGRVAARLRELAKGLRSLRDTYLRTTTPRLREALLREAGEIVRRLRRFGAERA